MTNKPLFSVCYERRMSVSGRSSQSFQVITRTRNHDVKSFGMPLPVLVTEALTYADSKCCKNKFRLIIICFGLSIIYSFVSHRKHSCQCTYFARWMGLACMWSEAFDLAVQTNPCYGSAASSPEHTMQRTYPTCQ